MLFDYNWGDLIAAVLGAIAVRIASRIELDAVRAQRDALKTQIDIMQQQDLDALDRKR